jgi:dimethylargininase
VLTAITRKVSPRLGACEVSFKPRQEIDVALAVRQHAAYEALLAELGARVVSLPALPDQPDCVFVEDPAVVLDEIAVITRMGAESRRGESESLAQAVAAFRELRRMEAPATLEGGDVMRAGRTLYAGLSRRTNVAGIQHLARMVEPFGYWVTPSEVRGCLHLKSACCYLGGNTVLANRQWVDVDALCGLRVLDIPAAEPHAANALRIGDTVVLPAAYPATRALLEQSGFHVRVVDTSELAKAEGSVTCMSLVFDSPGRAGFRPHGTSVPS